MDERDLNQKLLEEIFKALGWGIGHPLRVPLSPLFSTASRRFARIAVRFDQDVAAFGFRDATCRLLPHFARDVHVGGAEHVPANGPLLVVSNHLGAIDGLAIAGHLHRPDLKIVVSGAPFIRHLRATANHLIYSSLDTFERMKVVRSAIRHLEDGGAVLLFPSGGIDPESAVMPGALEEVGKWSPSLEVILRRGRRGRQRVAEFFQVIQQMLFPGQLLVSPSVRFARPLQFDPCNGTSVLPGLIAAAREHFRQVQG